MQPKPLTPMIRKTVLSIDTLFHDGGEPIAVPLRRAVCAAVIANPFAGTHEQDLMPWMEALRPLGIDLTRQLLAALDVAPEAIHSFGKGALVGVDGEHEHAAIWHTPGGAGLKSVLNAVGFVTAGQAMGAVGASLHIPLVYKNSPWVRSHFDAVDLCIADAPRPREVIFAVAVSTGPRVHQRLGGVTVADVEAGRGPGF